jgi:glycosyltransferase involved in cell wall biosynthesis
LRKNVFNAQACLFVTESKLQSKYPTSPSSFSISVSNVNLEEKYFSECPAIWSDKDCYNILSIGSLEQMYKSPDVLIKAMKIVNEYSSKRYYLTWLGGGKYQNSMVEMALLHGLDDLVKFEGIVNKGSVYSYLKTADCFVLASRTEGLPRVIIEAMSVGLPIIGTNVGGIPELIDEEVLVTKNNEFELAGMILNITADGAFYNSQAKKNWVRSRMYSNDKLTLKRNLFYDYILKNC